MKAFFFQKVISSANFDKFSHFCKKTLNSGGKKTFLWYSIIWYEFYRKFATFHDFEKFQFFFRKTNLFFQKTSNFVRFEKSNYFSRILRQICFDLVIDFQRQNRRTSDIFTAELSFALSRWFSFHITYGRKITNISRDSADGRQLWANIDLFHDSLSRLTTFQE